MEWLAFGLAVGISLVAIVVAAGRATRHAPAAARQSDDPHAGLLAEMAWQRGPRIYG